MASAHDRLRLTLEAEGRPGLFEILIRAVGGVVADRWEVADLLAVGRQSFVFLAFDKTTKERVVIKQSAFDYRRPIEHSRRSVAHGRARLKREHRVLGLCPTRHMPRPIALETSAPLVAAAKRTSVLGTRELFLVEEWVEGSTMTELGLSSWPDFGAAIREKTAARAAREFIEFHTALERAGWFYPDVSSNNFLVEPSGTLRVVDAGSAIKQADEIIVRGFTPAFTTPRIYDRLKKEASVPGRLSTVLPALAKVLHFALTRKEPLNGALPEIEALSKTGHSEACTAAIRALLALDESPSEIEAAKRALDAWSL